jgi:hypothetical protein
MQKIIEIKTEDWTKGISAQKNKSVGGLFSTLSGIDPFYNEGLCVPSLTSTTITPSSTPKFITNFNSAGVAYTYWHSDTEIKQVLKDSPYTQVDKSSEIQFGGFPVIGATTWRGKYVYARAGSDLRLTTIPVASGTNVQIRTGFGSVMDSMPLCVGADDNLYNGDAGTVGVQTSVSGLNSGSFTIGNGFYTRDLINDGQYLVILADNNSSDSTGSTASRMAGNFRCRIFFWDMKKSLADVVYDIDDSYLIAGQQLDGNIYFFGYNGLYVCNSATPPRLIRPFIGYNGLSTAKPKNSYQLVKHKGSLFWVEGFDSIVTNGVINAYGNPTFGGSKIFYQPHLTGNQGDAQTVLQVVGEQFWTGTDTPAIYVNNIGSTNGDGIVSFSKRMSAPYKYDFTKIVLSVPLSSGQSVSLIVTKIDGTIISANETKLYSASNPRQNLIFKITPSSNSQNIFEDIKIYIVTAGASVQRVSVYATPLEDANEII